MVENEIISEQQAPAEKMVPQSEVNDIIRRKQAAAADKARAEMQADYDAKLAQATQAPQHNAVDEDALFNKMQERFNQEQQDKQQRTHQDAQNAEMERLGKAYNAKMGIKNEEHEDFDDITSKYNPQAFWRTSLLAADRDNTAGIIYELSKDPKTLATIEFLAEKNPDQAVDMMKKLEGSISDVKTAKQNAAEQNANNPLSRMQSSTVGSDSGKMSIKELRSQPWLRG